MVWLQAVVCFAIWVTYGVILRKHSEKLRAKMANYSRVARVLFGSALLIAALVMLVFGIWSIDALGWHYSGQLTILGLVATMVLGLVFIRLQVTGAAAMISLVVEEVTGTKDRPSVPLENP